MANINVAVDKPIADGYKLKFRTPCDSTVIEGLEVKYPAKDGVGTLIKKFVFKDAHGTELSGVGNLFVSGVMIEVLLDVTHGVAYIQNADTNSYVESVKGEIQRLEENQRQFLGVAGKSVEECEQATTAAVQATNTLLLTHDDVVNGGYVKALKELNTGGKFSFWVGTTDEYTAITEKVNNCFYILTDDSSRNEILVTLENLESRIESNEFDIDALKGQDLTSAAFISDLQAKDKELESKIDDLQSEIDAGYKTKESETYGGCFYRTSTRGFTEWLNAPMLHGVEYLTTERHNSEPVWVKLVELGALPTITTEGEDATKDIFEVVNGKIIWYDAWATKVENDVVQNIPLMLADNNWVKVHIYSNATNKNNIQITATRNMPNYYGHALIKFTRPNVVTNPVTTEWERAMLERIDLALLHTVALCDVPKCESGVTAKGEVLTGINYSSVYDNYDEMDDKTAQLVGTGVSLSTYYSAMNNPASAMYALGDISYREDVSSFYGISCSGFVSYVVGFKDDKGNPCWKWNQKMLNDYGGTEYSEDSGYGRLPIVTLEDLDKVRRGDIILAYYENDGGTTTSHVKIVRDVLYDIGGNLRGFNVAHSIVPYVECVFMTPEEFLAQLTETNPYIVIRLKDSEYSTDVKKVEYSKSIYPNKGDRGTYTVVKVNNTFKPSKLKKLVSKTADSKDETGKINYTYTYEEICDDDVWLYIPDTNATSITVNGCTTYQLANMGTNTVNGVTVYLFPETTPGAYRIATDTAPADDCLVIIKEEV